MVDIDRFDEALDRFWDDLTASNEPVERFSLSAVGGCVSPRS